MTGANIQITDQLVDSLINKLVGFFYAVRQPLKQTFLFRAVSPLRAPLQGMKRKKSFMTGEGVCHMTALLVRTAKGHPELTVTWGRSQYRKHLFLTTVQMSPPMDLL